METKDDDDSVFLNVLDSSSEKTKENSIGANIHRVNQPEQTDDLGFALLDYLALKCTTEEKNDDIFMNVVDNNNHRFEWPSERSTGTKVHRSRRPEDTDDLAFAVLDFLASKGSMKEKDDDLFMNVVDNNNRRCQWSKESSIGTKKNQSSPSAGGGDRSFSLLDVEKSPVSPSYDTATTDTTETHPQRHITTEERSACEDFQPIFEATFLEDKDVWFSNIQKQKRIDIDGHDTTNLKKKSCFLNARHAANLLAGCFTKRKDLLRQKNAEPFEIIEPVPEDNCSDIQEGQAYI